MFPLVLRRVALALIFCCIVSPQGARAAGRVYFEVAAGLSQLRGADGLFSTPLPDALALGTSLSAAMAISLTSQRARVGVHFGAQARQASGSDNGTQYALQSLYPFLRIDGNQRVFMSFGYSPWIFRRVATSPGFDGFQRQFGAMGGLFEVGYVAPVTPAVALIASFTSQLVRQTDGSFSPRPTVEGSAGLRIYFDAPANFGGGDGVRLGRDDYKGWRYPFGRLR